jgi:hypothetical protein
VGIIQPEIALTSGDRLETQEILSSLGAGGMAEVHPARYTRLDRIADITKDPQFS